MADITATPIKSERARLDFLPGLAGSYFMALETALFRIMDKACPDDYSGGYWEYVRLSNGGGFAYPTAEEGWNMTSLNGWQGLMSAEAAGICVTLTALSHLSFIAHDKGSMAVSQKLAENFYLLRDFALEHSEQRDIFAFID